MCVCCPSSTNSLLILVTAFWREKPMRSIASVHSLLTTGWTLTLRHRWASTLMFHPEDATYDLPKSIAGLWVWRCVCVCGCVWVWQRKVVKLRGEEQGSGLKASPLSPPPSPPPTRPPSPSPTNMSQHIYDCVFFIGWTLQHYGCERKRPLRRRMEALTTNGAWQTFAKFATTGKDPR